MNRDAIPAGLLDVLWAHLSFRIPAIVSFAILCWTSHPLWAAEIKADDVAANDVCAYIAATYNDNGEKEIYTRLNLKSPVDIYNNGKPEKVELIHEGNRGGYHLGVGVKENGRPIETGQYDAEGLWKLDNIYVINFKGRNYVVAEQDGGPIDVTDLGKGNICRFRWTWKASIDEDLDHELCARAANEEEFPEVSFDAAPTADQKIYVPSFKHNMYLSQKTRVMLDGIEGPIFVGKIFQMLPGGIESDMVTLLNDKTEASDQGQNLSLLAFEEDFLRNVWGGRVFVAHIGNRNLVEADKSAHYNQITPPRILLRFSGNNIETICRISEKVTFTPSSPYDDMAPRKGAVDLFTFSAGGQRDVLEKEKQKKLDPNTK